MAKEGILELEGVVEESIKDKFKVRISDEYVILATLSGKIRLSAIRILPGDKVKVEASVYSPTLGRITFRLKS
jgi:translation initiation factor IF-1